MFQLISYEVVDLIPHIFSLFFLVFLLVARHKGIRHTNTHTDRQTDRQTDKTAGM